jgi:general secretion pathway protein K
LKARDIQEKAEGFALILVVWFLVLVAAIGAYLVANGRAETKIAHNVRAAASAEALADAGIARVVINQTDTEIANRWKLDGASHAIVLPSGRIEIRLADETRKINPNLASDTLLAALFEVSGIDHSAAQRLGAAVADWVGAPAQEGAAKSDPYRAAGRSYSAPHAPVESLDELGLVLGMTPEILASVRPYLSIYAEAATPDARIAPLVIQRALAMAARARKEGEDEPSAPSGGAAQPAVPQPGAMALPAAAVPSAKPGAKPAAPEEERMIEAKITAHSRDGGVFVRYAVLKLAPECGKASSVLDWRRDTLDDRGK